jgi:hypothetical protein
MTTANLKQKIDDLIAVTEGFILELNKKDALIDQLHDDRNDVENLLIECLTVLDGVGVSSNSVIVHDIKAAVQRLAASNPNLTLQ